MTPTKSMEKVCWRTFDSFALQSQNNQRNEAVLMIKVTSNRMAAQKCKLSIYFISLQITAPSIAYEASSQ